MVGDLPEEAALEEERLREGERGNGVLAFWGDSWNRTTCGHSWLLCWESIFDPQSFGIKAWLLFLLFDWWYPCLNIKLEPPKKWRQKNFLRVQCLIPVAILNLLTEYDISIPLLKLEWKESNKIIKTEHIPQTNLKESYGLDFWCMTISCSARLKPHTQKNNLTNTFHIKVSTLRNNATRPVLHNNYFWQANPALKDNLYLLS